MQIQTAMVLAAGRGTRMKHLTDNCPKPLVKVAEDTLLGHILDKVQSYGIKNVVVNTGYKGEMIKEECAKHVSLNFKYSDEKTLLETGGGVKKALPHLMDNGAENGFFVLNADPIWNEPSTTLLDQLSKAWNPEKMDILLAIVPMKQAFGDVPEGNYFIENGKLRRKTPTETNVPYLFMGIQILHPRIFNKELPDIFSLRDLYDEAQVKGRLEHIIFDGQWFHVGTPEAFEQTNKQFLIKRV